MSLVSVTFNAVYTSEVFTFFDIYLLCFLLYYYVEKNYIREFAQVVNYDFFSPGFFLFFVVTNEFEKM